MYNLKTNTLFLEIPKNASRSVVAASLDHYGKQNIVAEGHATFKDFVTSLAAKSGVKLQNPIETCVIVRNPVERLFSQVRHNMRTKMNITLDQMMKAAWEQSNVIYKPQWKFLEVPQQGSWEMDLHMWDDQRVIYAVNYMTGHYHNYSKNTATNTSDEIVDKVLAHSLFDNLMHSPHHYGPDKALWIRASRTNANGEEK